MTRHKCCIPPCKPTHSRRRGQQPIPPYQQLLLMIRIGRPDECWPWLGSVDAYGYGQLSYGERRLKAHRVAHELWIGPIPEGLGVLHSCDNRPCCNSKHFFTGTNTDNVADMIAKGRHNPGHGIHHASAKLTPKQVLTIRSDLRSLRAIARDYGVSHSAIFKIKSDQSWKSVP